MMSISGGEAREIALARRPRAARGAGPAWGALALATALALAAWNPAQAQAQGQGLLFQVSGERGAQADVAGGRPDPVFAVGVDTVRDGAIGAGLSMRDDVVLAWPAAGNIYAQRGTLSFFFRPRHELGATAFPVMRVGAADGSAWDMTWLRIDWNGHGFDAFVTDTGLARSRVSFTMPATPRADEWIHLAFAWDETSGVRLWVNGKPAARKEIRAVYDSGLFGIGPFSRTVGPWQVQSRYNYMRSGDIDELRVHDRALDDRAVAALAAHQQPALQPAALPSVDDPALRAAWWLRHGWNRPDDVPPYLADPVTRIRKVEFSDARDLKEKMFKGIDGIRETTWPGVYNRSRLPGRNDYFQLPDWNVYSQGGKSYVLTLPDEPFNRIEINGPAHGKLVRASGDGQGVLARRAAGQERTSTQLPKALQGGTIRFDNDEQEVPIEEISAYHVGPGKLPEGYVTLSYTVDAGASLAPYANLDSLKSFIEGRYVPGERAMVAALPRIAPRRGGDGAASAAAAPKAQGMPFVHVLIPGDFRSPRAGAMPTRFSYGWENLDAGLDGIVLEIPALKVAPTHNGLLPLNIRIKDPLWPERDLLDVNVSVKPNEARTLWLDTRDRILPPTGNLYLTIAAAGGGFDAASLDGMGVRLVFKPADEARKEHIADRLEQARDNLAFLVEENPNIRPYPMWTRFELDVSDVLRVDPKNELARALWVEKNPEQPYGPFVQPAAPAGVPLWAFRQVEMLKLYRRFVNWWIDERQVENGEFGGGLSDDTDLTNLWVPLALMGDQPERTIASQRRMLDETFNNGMWTDGFPRIQTDELHVYEEGINGVAQSMQMRWGDPTAIERAMAIARNYPRIFQPNPAGHTHISSAYFSGSNVVHERPWAVQRTYGFLVSHPGMLLVDWNGAPATRSLLLQLMDGYLAHGKLDARGGWSFPANIDWTTDQGTGGGVGEAAHLFAAGYAWTGDEKYLRPFESGGARGNGPGGWFQLNADMPARLPAARKSADALIGRKGGAGGGERPGDGAADDGDTARLLRWQKTGDKAQLAALFGHELQQNTQRYPVMTIAHLWSDRVNVSNEMLQRTRMGGVAHRRNAYYPGNLVSWRFTSGASAEDVALLIPEGDPRHFKVIAYNLTGKPIHASMSGAQLAPGEWTMSGGVDANDDDRADNPSALQQVRLERGRAVALEFPAGQSVFEFTLARAGDDPATRADIGISVDDLKVAGNSLGLRVHSLGARPTPAGTAILEDASGKQLATARFPALEAPLDLRPRTADLRMALPAGADPSKLRVRLALDGAPDEITDANNTAGFVRATLETDRVR